MPSQQVEVAEAITGIKRALKRDREAPSAQSIAAATNRGNKLKNGAKYVHEGSLAYASGPEVYKKRIEYAGHTRYILDRNPRRYNEYGEELEDSETDEEADADAADENAYSGICLEELLCPLKHPSELPVHPTMSHAYVSNALPGMVLSAHEKLRQERANLWRAKYLNRQLVGDASWIPAGEVESPGDWDLFEPRTQSAQKQSTRKRKRQDDKEHEDRSGNNNQSVEEQSEPSSKSKEKVKLGQVSHAAHTDEVDAKPKVEVPRTAGDWPLASGETTQIKEAHESKYSSDRPTNATLKVVDSASSNGIQRNSEQNGVDEGVQATASSPPPNPTEDGALAPIVPKVETGEGTSIQTSRMASDEEDGSSAPPPRRITRALAANNTSHSHSNAATPPLSPDRSSNTTLSSSQLQIDPLYIVSQPANFCSSALAFHGLLAEEALETRRLLTLYIQKQEESVRGYEAVLSKLLKAQRLRSEVLAMCKAEEHVGELSDGEDWIDAEQWGLQSGELRKGRDEDEDLMEENTIGGRKGKRRARN